jgi:hypothetical protein
MPDLTVAALPQHCRLVSIFPGEQEVAVRVCAIVQTPADAAASLILLQSSALGRAYLGALADRAGRVLGWCELWVQGAGSASGLDENEAGTNPELDHRWQQWAAAVAAQDAIIETGREKIHPAPVWLDVAAGRAITPVDPGSGEPYELCRDDAALLVAGLEPFSDSRRRWLAVRGQPGAGFVDPSAEAAGSARSIQEVLPNGGDGLLAFNPEGGFLLVRRLPPLAWADYAAVLSGGAWAGLSAGKPPVKLTGPYAALSDWDRLQQEGTHLFYGSRGRAGRFHESFHLKLRLLVSMLRAVKARVGATQLPQLNLSASAFRVDLPADTGALPVLWAARAVLVEPPGAVALSAPGDLRYFKPVDAADASIYRPEGAGRSLRGRGEVRIRRVLTTGDRTQVEATVVSPEIAPASPRDLVWVRVPLPGTGTIDLVGNIDAAEALAQGEARFRTAPLEPGAGLQAALKAAEGGVFPGTGFRTLPLLSSPVDLYAVGVLGAHLFLTGSGRPLATAVDELLSLRRALAERPADGSGQSVRELVAVDERWNRSLGPHHHGHETESAEAAGALLPLELWWDTVALLGRFFPGSGPEAFCRDFGDAPPQRIEEAFTAPLIAAENLLLRSQSLLLCDWPANREIARVIQKLR